MLHAHVSRGQGLAVCEGTGLWLSLCWSQNFPEPIRYWDHPEGASHNALSPHPCSPRRAQRCS